MMDCHIYQTTTKPDLLIGNELSTYASYSLLFLIGNTINEEDFKEMINEVIKKRESFILKKHGMDISTDPRIVKALEKTSMISSNTINFKLA